MVPLNPKRMDPGPIHVKIYALRTPSEADWVMFWQVLAGYYTVKVDTCIGCSQRSKYRTILDLSSLSGS